MPSKHCEPSKSIVVKVSGVSHERAVLRHLRVVQSADVEVTRRGSEDVSPRNGGLDGCHLDTFKARLPGAEGVTFANEHTSTRTNESESANLANIAAPTSIWTRRFQQLSLGDPVYSPAGRGWVTIGNEHTSSRINLKLPVEETKLSCRPLGV